MKGPWYSILMGGLAFWLPVVTVSAIYRDSLGLWMQNVAPLLGLTALALIDWTRKERAGRWNWALARVYMLGPISMMIEGWSSGATAPWKGSWGSVLFVFVICLLPPMTLWLSALDGQIFSVLAASAVLPLLAILDRRSRSHA